METLTLLRNTILILGAVAWIILLILKLMGKEDPTKRKPKPREPEPQSAAEPPGVCKVCKYVNSAGAARCYQCGNTLL